MKAVLLLFTSFLAVGCASDEMDALSDEGANDIACTQDGGCEIPDDYRWDIKIRSATVKWFDNRTGEFFDPELFDGPDPYIELSVGVDCGSCTGGIQWQVKDWTPTIDDPPPVAETLDPETGEPTKDTVSEVSWNYVIATRISTKYLLSRIRVVVADSDGGPDYILADTIGQDQGALFTRDDLLSGEASLDLGGAIVDVSFTPSPGQ